MITLQEYTPKTMVQVKRNVGSLGLQWLNGEYETVIDGRHFVRLTDGDQQEIVSCDDDAIRLS